MLPGCNAGSSRCVRRALILVFAWGLVMIAAVQFRHAENTYASDHVISTVDVGVGGIQEVSSGGSEAAYRRDSGNLPMSGLSRYLLQRSPGLDSALTSRAGNSPLNAFISALTAGGNGNGEALRTTTTTKRNSLEMEPLLDKRPAKSEDEMIQDIENKLPSLPLAYWFKSYKFMNEQKSTKGHNGNGKSSGAGNESSCASGSPKFPAIFDLEFNNIYWQTLRSSNGTFQLFGAYYDNRKLSRIGPAIRIVGMIDRIEPTVKTHCQMWYEGEKEPRVVEILEYKYIWFSKWGNYKQGIYQPYIIACKVPQSHWKRGAPSSVSLVEKPCETASNNLRVIYNKPEKKKDFAVCVKGLDFLHEDLSVRLVEWIELITLLGADKIYFYELQVHPNVTKVLEHYQRIGKVHVTPLTLPGGQPNVPSFQHLYLTKKTNHKRQNELIPYNDCLYKHMYEYEYIALLDVDEVIMPVRDATWQELMHKRVLPKAFKIRNETRASYNVRNVYFLDDLLHSHGHFKDIPK